MSTYPHQNRKIPFSQVSQYCVRKDAALAFGRGTHYNAPEMVCPMRIFVFAASLVLVLASLGYFIFADEQPAFLSGHAYRQRTWWQFIRSFFTGELIRDAWYGPPASSDGGGGGGGDGGADLPPPPRGGGGEHEE